MGLWEVRGYIIDRDFESAKHGYSAKFSFEVYEAEITLIFKELDNRCVEIPIRESVLLADIRLPSRLQW